MTPQPLASARLWRQSCHQDRLRWPNLRDHAKEFAMTFPGAGDFLEAVDVVDWPQRKNRTAKPPVSARGFEAELAIVIGKRCRNLGVNERRSPLHSGYTCMMT